jgi:hypothetical protein
MSRTFVSGVASILALLTLDVQAQTPNPFGSSADTMPGVQPRPLFAAPLQDKFWDKQPSREELELAKQSAKLIKQLGKAEGESKDKIKTQLTETLGKQFDLRQKRHEAEIAALEAQLKKLKELVQKRQENRREIIGKRLDQLVREADGLGW